MMRTNSWIPTVFNDLFDTDFMPKVSATAPAINVKESDKGYTVELAAPGMQKEDFNVHINDEGNLIIKMEKKNEQKEDKSTRYLRREFSYSKFEQTLILPDDVKKQLHHILKGHAFWRDLFSFFSHLHLSSLCLSLQTSFFRSTQGTNSLFSPSSLAYSTVCLVLA